jgi:phosphoribosylglycinamide formyltransferase-1
MTNEQRAEALINELGFDFDAIDKERIRSLIEEEVANYQPGSSEYIRVLCGYLYCIGDESDVPLLEKAKYNINFDVGCMIDLEWIDSLGNRTTDYQVRSREELISDFVNYYQGFEADDLY